MEVEAFFRLLEAEAKDRINQAGDEALLRIWKRQELLRRQIRKENAAFEQRSSEWAEPSD